MNNYSNVNAIMLIKDGSRGLEYEYLSVDIIDTLGLLLYDESIPIEPEYEFGFPTQKGIYKANVSVEYSEEYGTQTTMNNYELIHDLNL